MTKETKSERLFRHAFFDAKRAIESLGAGKIDALSSLHDGTDEVIYKRTVNDIRKHAERLIRRIDLTERYCARAGKKVPDSCETNREAVAIVLKTCDNWEREKAELKTRLASL